jgi:predicted HTH domain antitoxin
LGHAALSAGLPQMDFQRMLASRDIPLHYGITLVQNRSEVNEKQALL